MELTKETTINELLRAYPQTAGLLNQYNLDTCCGGGNSLAVEASHVGVDLDRLLAELREIIGQ